MPVARDVIRCSFIGDTLIGGEGQAVFERQGYSWAFDGIRHLFAQSDLIVANLEGPITDREEPGSKSDTGRKRYWYRALPGSIDALVDVGVGVVGLANNHVLDFGPEGLRDTIAALDDANIAHCGAGADRKQARRPVVVNVSNGRMELRIGFTAIMQRYDLYIREDAYARSDRPGPMRHDRARITRDLKRLDARCDLTVVLAHWGRNYRKRNPRQSRLARELVSAGAGLVIGHHPHIAQQIRVVNDVPVCFSLGNGPLATPGRFHSGRPPYGLVVTAEIEASGSVRALEVTPIRVDNASVNFRPVIADQLDEIVEIRRLLGNALQWDLVNDSTLRCSLEPGTAAESLVIAS